MRRALDSRISVSMDTFSTLDHLIKAQTNINLICNTFRRNVKKITPAAQAITEYLQVRMSHLHHIGFVFYC